MANRIQDRIGFLDSPGEFEDWDIYWTAGVSVLRSVGHVLHKVDSKQSELHRFIIQDFWDNSGFKSHPIFTDLIEGERNAVLKSAASIVTVAPYTTSSFADRGMSFEELCQKNGKFFELSWEGDDALRLFEIAIIEWHRHLSIIERSIEEGIRTPYSIKGLSYELLDRSEFVTRLPKPTGRV